MRGVLGFLASASGVCAEIGSSLVVKMRQKQTFFGIVACLGGFFFGHAKREPKVFLGGMSFRARQEPRFFVRRRRF